MIEISGKVDKSNTYKRNITTKPDVSIGFINFFTYFYHISIYIYVKI